MKKICFIVAMEDEIESNDLIKNENFQILIKQPFKILQCLNFQNLYIIFSSIGMVCAASATQYMIDHYQINHFINLGSSGTLNPNANPLDCYLIQKAFYGDCDLTAFHYQINQMAKQPIFFESDKKINEYLLESTKKLNWDFKIGTCYSINSFLNQQNQQKFLTLISQNPTCVEMELIGISQVCFHNHCTWSAIKIISDSIFNSKLNADQFKNNLKFIQKKLTQIIINFKNYC